MSRTTVRLKADERRKNAPYSTTILPSKSMYGRKIPEMHIDENVHMYAATVHGFSPARMRVLAGGRAEQHLLASA